MSAQDSIQVTIGEDRSLPDVLGLAEATPLISTFLAGGAEYISIGLPDGTTYLEAGKLADRNVIIEHGLFLEGEQVGLLRVSGASGAGLSLDRGAMLLRDILTALMTNNLKRALTTEVHAQVMELSYNELLSINKNLAASEERYRLLSQRLEEEVQDRTRELREAYAQMYHQKKMAAVGQLAAGIAHEINNPIGFITANLNVLKRYAVKITTATNTCRSFAKNLPTGTCGHDNLEKIWQDMKIDFILDDLGALVAQCLEGTDRIAGIISHLMVFSGTHEEADRPMDVQDALEKTLEVMASQIPADAVIERHYETVGQIVGSPSLICQAFYTVILNAFQARPQGLRLALRIEQDGDRVRIVIDDNGPGIPEDILGRIFEPFFTTREVGSGQGMGLTIAYQIVTQSKGFIQAGVSDDGGARITMEFPLEGASRV